MCWFKQLQALVFQSQGRTYIKVRFEVITAVTMASGIYQAVRNNIPKDRNSQEILGSNLS
jgi:hypothetical protein